ncbi:MAG TPA: hypothetical protein VFT06_06290 [Flavisolibacter sp.]|nr:hypothetical protein [Flavisolibacter sp.]
MPTQTTYRSPIKLLALTPAESTSFSSDTIEVAKNRLGNTAASEEVRDSLQHVTPATWAFHRTVYEQDGLLQFLEEGVFDEESMRKAAFLGYNPSFVQFISVPFAQAFQIASKEALRKKDDYQTLQKLLDYRSFILPPHQAIAFDAINDYLRYLEQTLALLSWEQFVRDEAILDFAFSPHWIHCINQLPAACDTQRTAVASALLQVLKRFRLDAAPDYLKALCARLRQLTTEPGLQEELQQYESGFQVQKTVEQETAKKPAKHYWVYYAGGLLLVLAAIFLVLRLNKQNKRSPQAEDKYMDAVETTSAKDQLKSSINEKNLKGFFYLASRQENKGKRASVQTGTTPITDVTKMPANDGNSTMTIRNETTADALLFYFGSDNPLINKNSRLVAVYIKSGDVFRFRFQPDFGRFNFVFGREWVHLDDPVFFPFTTGESNNVVLQDNEKLLANAWVIRDFFRRVLPSQPFLRHDLTITNIAQPTESTSGAPVYTLLNKKEGNKRYSDAASVEIDLQEKDGKIVVGARSSLYVYQSPPTFDPKDFQ